jgi:hypothetical protein
MNTFEIGDLVELVSIPEAVIEDKERFPETLDLFARALQKQFRIRSFNEYGFAEFWLHEDASEDESGTDHSVWVEQQNLKKVV